ncbi:MAG: DUF4827 family protein [Paludibacter sp.]
MKQIFYLIIFAFTTSLFFSSCGDTSYANELKQEKLLIAEYIKRNNINVLSDFPSNKKWGENDYVLTKSGLYFHLVDSGDIAPGDTIVANDVVVPRYKEYNLYAEADTLTRNWSTVDYPDPGSFKYLDLSESCPAFHEAASYMIRNNSRAKLIVKSKIGFERYWTPATPLAYEIKIKVLK